MSESLSNVRREKPPQLYNFMIGHPMYSIGPLEKTLWTVAIRFSEEDLKEIYQASKQYNLAFGKVWRIYMPDAQVDFECWYPCFTWERVKHCILVDEHLKQYRSSRDIALSAAEAMKKGFGEVVKLFVHFKWTDNQRWYTGTLGETVYGDTYAQAIRDGVLQIGLDRANVL